MGNVGLFHRLILSGITDPVAYKTFALSEKTGSLLVWNGSIWLNALGAVDVASYATAGAGTLGSPWTGWDTAITWTEKRIYLLRPGYYSYSASIALTDDLSLIGAGPSATIVTYTGTGNGLSFIVTDPSLGYRLRLADFKLVGSGSAAHGIALTRVVEEQTLLDNLWVMGFGGDGVNLDECIAIKLGRIRSTNNAGRGIYVGKSNHLLMDFCCANGNDGHGIYIAGGATADNSRIEVRTCRAESNGGSGLVIGQRRNFEVAGGWYENNTSHGIDINGESDPAEVGSIVAAHVIGGALAVAGASGIRLANALQIHVERNYVDGFSAKGKDILFTADSSHCTSWNNYNSAGLFTPTDLGDANTRGGESGGGVRLWAGMGDDQGAVNMTIYTGITTAGNVGAGEDDLINYSLPANTLSTDSTGLRVTCWGKTANNVNNKRLKLYFGATAIFDSGVVAPQDKDWRIVAEIIRTAVGAQVSAVSGIYNATAVCSNNNALAIDETAAIAVKCTGEATSDNDITQNGMLIEYLINP